MSAVRSGNLDRPPAGRASRRALRDHGAACTGARGNRVLGALTPGAGPLRLPAPLELMPTRLVMTDLTGGGG